MNDATNVKQQIIEHIKQSANILVTVSRDSSVDELSAALGLTLMLNKLKKHATAVVSGAIPPAIQFLEPNKTFEGTVDSLRDFIIALDKEKADHLRYKVDGDVVKIFITPYRTTISEDDLQFSQGDYNVELVLALGVTNKDHLDKALESHGRILHDAVVVSLGCGEQKSELGSINWNDSSASSVSEMLVSLSEAIKGDEPLLDEPIATAFLTGIVSATDRFSNNKTSSRVMTMAAQLMAAGANQQLIAAKLTEAHEISSDSEAVDVADENNDGTTDMSEGASSKIEKQSKSKKKPTSKPDDAEKTDDGSLAINHELQGTPEDVAKQVQDEKSAEATEKAEDMLANELQSVAAENGGATSVAAAPSVADLQKDIAAASADVEVAASTEPALNNISPNEIPTPDYEPTFGGTLNATAEQAAADKKLEAERSTNRTILSHDSAGQSNISDAASTVPAFTAAMQPEPVDQNIEPLMAEPQSTTPPPAIPTIEPIHETLADLDTKARAPHSDALAAVEAAYTTAPFDPANNPVQAAGAQQLGDVPHDAPLTAPPLPPTLPDFTVLPPPPPPPLPSAPVSLSEPVQQLGQVFGDMPTVPGTTPAPQPASTDPAEFKIPGQS